MQSMNLMAETFEEQIGRIPKEIIDVLLYIADNPMSADNSMSADNQEVLTDIFSSSSIRAAYAMIEQLPTNRDLRSSIVSFANDSSSPENREFLFRNPAFFRAFPVLKQIYEVEDPNLETADEERKNAVKSYIKMFGKDNLPSSFIEAGRTKEEETAIIRDMESKLANITSREEEQNAAYTKYKNKKAPSSEDTDNKINFIKNVPPREDVGYADEQVYEHIKNQDSKEQDVGYADEQVHEHIKNQDRKEQDEFRLKDIPPPKGKRSTSSEEGFLSEVDTTINKAEPGYLDPNSDIAKQLKKIDEKQSFPSEVKSGRDKYTIEKDVAITEALDNGDYDRVRRIEEAYEKKEKLSAIEATDDWSYFGKYRQGGLVGYQEGGDVPLEADPAYNEPSMGFVGTPEEGAMDQAQAAENGEMGGDNVETVVPEGSFVLNSYAVELAGIKDIEKLIDDAKKFLMGQMSKQGFAPQTETGANVEVHVSEGEYTISADLVRVIGRDRLEKINKRGIAEFERQQSEEKETGGQEMPQEPQGPQVPQGFMPPQEGGAPMPEELPPEEVQSFALGGEVQQQQLGQAQQGKITISEDTLKAALASKPYTPPKPAQQKIARVPNKNAVQRTQQSPSPLARVNPASPGVQNLQNPNVRRANMGGFIPYSRNG